MLEDNNMNMAASANLAGQGGTTTTGSLADLKEAISALSKAASLVARRRARRRVLVLADKEAPPSRFLHFEHYNVRAAACHLAAFWRIRNKVFGKRFLLPMTLTGEGTLTFDDGITRRFRSRMTILNAT
jgi:hypothetical protein